MHATRTSDEPIAAARAAICPVCTQPRPEAGCRLCAAGLPRTGPGLWPVDLGRGFRIYVGAAARLLNDKAYMGRISWAVTLSVVLAAAFAVLVVIGVAPLAAMLAGWLPWGGPQAAVPIAIVTCLLLLPALTALFLFPVLDPLARASEEEALGFAPAAHPRGPIAAFWVSIDAGARVLPLQVPVWVVAVALSPWWVGVPIALLANALFAGLLWLDYPCTRRDLAFASRWRLARRHWALVAGFGLAFELGLLVPFFSPCLVALAAAVGSSDLYLQLAKDEPA